MVELKQAVGKQVVVKATGWQIAVSCQLVSLDEAGIWISSPDLEKVIRNSFAQVVLPYGRAKMFVPFTRLDFLVHSTED
jgi:hypothetical protein